MPLNSIKFRRNPKIATCKFVYFTEFQLKQKKNIFFLFLQWKKNWHVIDMNARRYRSLVINTNWKSNIEIEWNDDIQEELKIFLKKIFIFLLFVLLITSQRPLVLVANSKLKNLFNLICLQFHSGNEYGIHGKNRTSLVLLMRN